MSLPSLSYTPRADLAEPGSESFYAGWRQRNHIQIGMQTIVKVARTSRAMAMADRSNLDLSSLGEDDDVGEIVQRWIPVGARLPREKQLALGIVQTYFNVDPGMFKSRASVVFIGTESDIAIAEYVFEFLTRTSRNYLKTYEAVEKKFHRPASGTKRANFYAGFFYGVAQRLAQQRSQILLEDQKFAIVLSDQARAREEYSQVNLGPTHAVVLRKPRRNYSAFESGFHDGKRTTINPGLPAKESRLCLT